MPVVWSVRSFAALCIFFFLLTALEAPLKGYADPGSGALLWQILAGGFVGIIFQARRISRWFRSRKGD